MIRFLSLTALISFSWIAILPGSAHAVTPCADIALSEGRYEFFTTKPANATMHWTNAYRDLRIPTNTPVSIELKKELPVPAGLKRDRANISRLFQIRTDATEMYPFTHALIGDIEDYGCVLYFIKSEQAELNWDNIWDQKVLYLHILTNGDARASFRLLHDGVDRDYLSATLTRKD